MSTSWQSRANALRAGARGCTKPRCLSGRPTTVAPDERQRGRTAGPSKSGGSGGTTDGRSGVNARASAPSRYTGVRPVAQYTASVLFGWVVSRGEQRGSPLMSGTNSIHPCQFPPGTSVPTARALYCDPSGPVMGAWNCSSVSAIATVLAKNGPSPRPQAHAIFVFVTSSTSDAEALSVRWTVPIVVTQATRAPLSALSECRGRSASRDDDRIQRRASGRGLHPVRTP
jgi:hypothetical protein